MTVDAVAIATERQAEAADPQACVWVGASAGSGKTKVLVDRFLGLLLRGTDPLRILCLTFTKAAAAEMSVRVGDALSAWAAADDGALDKHLAPVAGGMPITPALRAIARQLFARVVDTSGGLRIMTIHAFCESVLRRFPVEAGVAPHFDVLSERDATDLLAAAQNQTIIRAAGDADLAAALSEITGHTREDGFRDLMRDFIDDRGRILRFIAGHGDVGAAVAATHAALSVARGATPASIADAACADGAFDRAALAAAAAALAETGAKTDADRAAPVRAWLDASPAERRQGYAGYWNAFFTGKGEPRAIRKKFAEAYPAAADALTDEAERLRAVAEARNKAVIANATAALLRFGAAILADYEAQKSLRALLDFDDLILKTTALLDRPDVVPWVMYKLDGGVDHILIDEAQDTSPDQWAIVRALAGEFFSGQGTRGDAPARTVFAVGDVKQSIYSFQRADPALFEANRKAFRRRTVDARGQWRDVDLHVSFRSGPPVLQAVDAVFADPVARDGVVPDDRDLHHLTAKAHLGGIVEIWPVLEAKPAAPTPTWRPPVDRVPGDNPRARLARLLARRIAEWLHAGEPLASGAPMRPGDVMVLVRQRGAFVGELVRALKDRDVPVAGVDRMLLTDQLAVMDLMALGAFLVLPEDDLSLATVLKGPFFNLTDEQLFDLAHTRPGSLWRALSDHAGAAGAFGAAHGTLAALLARVDFVRPYELFAGFLAAAGARQFYARLGIEAEDPIDEFLNRALEYERTHAPSLQGFLQWLSVGDVEVVRELQHDAGQVRVLTVHGAKGLQAPVVILPDTTQVPTKTDPLLWATPGPGDAPVMLWPPRASQRDAVCRAAHAEALAAQRREYRRLLYVAMTRASERLYICGWQPGRAAAKGCWHNLVSDAVAPIASQTPSPFLAAHGDLGDDAAVLRLFEPPGRPDAAAPAPPAAAAAPLPAWTRTAAPAEPRPPRPLAPSRAAGDSDPSVQSPVEPGARDALHRGILIHKLLQLLPDVPATERAGAAARFLARPGHRLDPARQAEIAAEVFAILDAPRFAALFGPESRAEVPLTGVIDGAGGDPFVVTGRVDRLVALPDRVQVIDYKTNRPPPADVDQVAAAYLRQMACYRSLLQGIYPDRAVECALLWTYGPRLMVLPDDRLATALPASL